MKRINVFCDPMYMARVELFDTRNLLYVKMLLGAQKEERNIFLIVVLL